MRGGIPDMAGTMSDKEKQLDQLIENLKMSGDIELREITVRQDS